MPTTERPLERISITFERGVNEGLAESMLPDGAVEQMKNFEASPTGEARTRKAWSKGSTTSAPATRKGVGIGFFSRLALPAFVQASDVVLSTGTSLSGTLSFTVPTKKGNTIIIVTAHADSDGATTGTAPTNFTQAVISADSSGEPRTAIYYRAGAPVTETITLGTIWSGFLSSPGYAQAFEFNGILKTSPLDVTASNVDTGIDTDLDTGTTGATAQAVGIAIGSLVLADSNGGAEFTGITSNYTQLGSITSDTNLGASQYYKLLTSTGTQQLTGTSTNSNESCGAIAVFKAWHSGAATPTSVTKWLVAQNDTTEYDFFSHDREDLSTGAWVNEASISVSDPSQHVAMAPGLGRVWVTNPQFTTPYYFDGENLTAITGAPAGRTVAVHKNRVFIAGSSAFPGRLSFSNIADGETWDELDYIDIAAEDGEPIEDITPLGEILVIGKRTGLWFLSGSGADTFDVQKLATGGLAPGRTLSPTPYGAVAVGRNFIWVVDLNGAVEKFSLPVTSSYMYSSGFITTSYVDDSVYINDPATKKQFVFNFQTGTWREENVDNASSTESPAVLGNHDGTQVYAPISGTTGSLLNYRDFPTGTTRTKDFDTLTEVFSLRTREIFPVGPEEACTPRHLYLRIRQHGGDATNADMTVTPQYREIDGTRTAGTAHTIQTRAAAGIFRERIDLAHKQGVSGIRFDFAQTLDGDDDACMDIEEVTLEYYVERIR